MREADGVEYATICDEWRELTVTEVDALSVTNTFATSVFPAFPFACQRNEFDDVSMFAPCMFVTLLYTMKLYVYGSVPPVSYAAKFMYCPASTSVLDAEIVGV